MTGRDWEPTDYDAMSQSYDAGRAMPEEWVAGWRFVLAEFLAEIRRPVVDVGSGTGIWAKMIADWFGVDVVGVEPSVGMRSRAIENRPYPRVTTSVAKPSIFRFGMRRVMRHGCRPSSIILRIWSTRRGTCAALSQTVGRSWFDSHSVAATTASCGRAHSRRRCDWPRTGIPPSKRFWRPSRKRISDNTRFAQSPKLSLQICTITCGRRTRTDSTLALISDEDFEAGLEELSRMAARSALEPVTATLDLLVFR